MANLKCTSGTADAWLARQRKTMIRCPYQPGNLMISKTACMKRHTAAGRLPTKGVADDFFAYALRHNLLRCRACPIARDLVSKKERLAWPLYLSSEINHGDSNTAEDFADR